MNAVQSRHMKLWFAGKALNWELAAYELRQLEVWSDGSGDALSGYSGNERYDDGKARPVDCRCDRGKG